MNWSAPTPEPTSLGDSAQILSRWVLGGCGLGEWLGYWLAGWECDRECIDIWLLSSIHLNTARHKHRHIHTRAYTATLLPVRSRLAIERSNAPTRSLIHSPNQSTRHSQIHSFTPIAIAVGLDQIAAKRKHPKLADQVAKQKASQLATTPSSCLPRRLYMAAWYAQLWRTQPPTLSS